MSFQGKLIVVAQDFLEFCDPFPPKFCFSFLFLVHYRQFFFHLRSDLGKVYFGLDDY